MGSRYSGMPMNILLFLSLAVSGWVAGLIVNILSDSLPVSRRISAPVCSQCGFNIPWSRYLLFELCPTCNSRRSIRSWIVQLGYPILFLLLGVLPSGRVTILESLVLVTYFGIVAVIDIEHRLVLHSISLVGVFIGLILGVLLHGPAMTLIGGAAGFGIMLALYYFGQLFAKFLSKSRGQPVDEVALGFGDVNLAGVLGLVMGWPGITACLFIAILIGGLVSGIFLVIMLITRSYRPFTALPYAPFLLLSAAFLLFRPI